MKFVLFFVLALFTGCTSLTKPETFNQKLAYVSATAEAIATNTATLYNRQVISREKALAITDQLEIAYLGLSNSRIAYGTGDIKSANDLLAKVNLILIQLEQQLKEAQNVQSKPSKSSFNSFYSLPNPA